MAQAVVIAAKAVGTFLLKQAANIAVSAALSFGLSKLTGGKRGSSSTRRGLTATISESDYPRRVLYGTGRIGGLQAYVESTGDENDFLHFVLVLADGPNESLQALYLNEQRVELVSDGVDANGITRWIPDGTDEDSEPYEEHIRVKFHSGTADQLADADLVDVSAGNWTAEHRLRGICYVYIRLKYSATVFETGLPNLSFLLEGRNDIEDPRDDSTGFSANAALCWRHYLVTERFGPQVAAAAVDGDRFDAQANLCDEAVTLLDTSTEARYEVNGVIDIGTNPRDNLADFEAAMGGWRAYVGGQFELTAGAHEVPTFTLTEDMLDGPVKVRNQVPKRERYNEVKAVYYSREHRYQFTDAPVRTKASYVTADGGESTNSLELALVSSGTQAQRLQSIALERGRFVRSVDLICNLRAFPAVAGRIVRLTLARYGWTQKLFLVAQSQPVFQTDGRCQMLLSLQEVGSTVYDWRTADELPVTTPPPLVNEGTKTATVTASPGSGVYMTTDFPQNVTLSSLTPGAVIRWSKSNVPQSIASGNEYTGPIEVDAGDFIAAVAFSEGFADSTPLLAVYSVEQVEAVSAAPVAGTYPSGDYPKLVTLSTATPGATIRHSTSAAILTDTDGAAYSAPVSVEEGQTLYARAFKTGLVDSEQFSGEYLGS